MATSWKDYKQTNPQTSAATTKSWGDYKTSQNQPAPEDTSFSPENLASGKYAPPPTTGGLWDAPVIGPLAKFGTGFGNAIAKTGVGIGSTFLKGVGAVAGIMGNKQGQDLYNKLGDTTENIGSALFDKPEQAQLSSLPGKAGQVAGTIATLGVPADAAISATKNIPAVASKLAERTTAKVIDMVSPKLTSTQGAKSISKLGTTISSTLKTITKNADPYIKKIADTVQKYVPDFDPTKTVSENLNKVRDTVYEMGDKLKQQVIAEGKNKLVQFQELGSKLSKADEPISLKGTPFEKQIAPLKDAVLEIAKKNGGTVADLFQTRKDFDTLVEKTWPNLYDKESAPMRSAVTAIRDVMNKYISDALPDVKYKESLTSQSHLFTAIENMSEKAFKEVGTNAIQRATSFVTKHPLVSGIGAYEAYGAAKKIPIVGGFLQ